jgi:hypothetical protein
MTHRYLPALAFGLSLCISTSAVGAVAQAQTEPTSPADRSGTSFPQPVNAAPVFTADMVEPDAVDALKAMSTYLMSLQTIEIRSEGSLDVVTGENQRIQMDGVTNYKVRRPGFVIDYVSDIKTRRFIYDGKNFTVYSPKLGFYATVPAPATNREVLNTLYDKFGIALPLEDLFRWADPDGVRQQALKSAYLVGTTTLDGFATNHYAFREDDVDWEVWIQQGDQPLPRKLVIVDRTDASNPTFISRLSWKVNPTFADSDFTFVPDKDAKRIQLATYKGSGE